MDPADLDHTETVGPHSPERIKALGGAVSVQNRVMFQSAAWSPVARFGGFHGESAGMRQTRAFAEAAADSEEQRSWR